FLFFFQAEDGIRAFHVTGVQTCALPICRWYFASLSAFWAIPARVGSLDDDSASHTGTCQASTKNWRAIVWAKSPLGCSHRIRLRSEERRVGQVYSILGALKCG